MRSVMNGLVEALQSNGWEETSGPKRTQRESAVMMDGSSLAARYVIIMNGSDKITENHNLRVFAPVCLPSINLSVIAMRNAGISFQGSVHVFR